MKPLKDRTGYPCINLELKEQGIYTDRGCTKKTFEAQRETNGAVSALAVKNTEDLVRIVTWNNQHGIGFFRMSSDMLPWMSEYEITTLPDWPHIEANLRAAGAEALRTGQRLTFHPGPFNVLASHSDGVAFKTIKELNQHAQVMDVMGVPASPWSKINIHVNTTRDGKVEAARRFCENFRKLAPTAQARLVVENDDKAAQYSVRDLYELIYREIGIPITFDVHHHKFNTGGLEPAEAAQLAASTWPAGVPPVIHFASTIHHEDRTKMARAHADWIYEDLTDFGTGAYLMCECKAKEKAILRYWQDGIIPSDFVESYAEEV